MNPERPKKSNKEPQLLRLDAIQLGAQIRGIRQEVVDDYAERLQADDDFPPLVVFKRATDGLLHLADGFHLYRALEEVGKKKALCDVRAGDIRDARLFAAGSNKSHGLRRSNEDKRRSVRALLDDEEWREWSDRSIADHVGVSPTFVGNMRKEWEATVNGGQCTSRRTSDGRMMDTENIGKKKENKDDNHTGESPPEAVEEAQSTSKEKRSEQDNGAKKSKASGKAENSKPTNRAKKNKPSKNVDKADAGNDLDKEIADLLAVTELLIQRLEKLSESARIDSKVKEIAKTFLKPAKSFLNIITDNQKSKEKANKENFESTPTAPQRNLGDTDLHIVQ